MFRYPGGKLRLMRKINELISDHYTGIDEANLVICEPFVGGGGSLIRMAQRFPNWRFCVNDINEDIAGFWKFFASASEPDIESFLQHVKETKPTLDSYNYMYDSKPSTDTERAFRVFFLNKTSYGGFITGRLPIGGKRQAGKWKVGCYWNPVTIRKRVKEAFAALHGRIESVSCLDFGEFLATQNVGLVYADPPYIKYGEQWYGKEFGGSDLSELIDLMDVAGQRWCLSIDVHSDVQPLLEGRPKEQVAVKYTAKSRSQKVESNSEWVVFKS